VHLALQAHTWLSTTRGELMLITTKDPELVKGLLASGWWRKGDTFIWIKTIGRA
jgi:hypothetical protein